MSELKVDVQCHIFPRSFVDELSKPDSQLKIATPDASGRRVILDSKTGDEVTYLIENSSYVDPDAHLRDMLQYKIDRQILSLPPPSMDKILDPDEAQRMSILVNDEIAGIVRKHPDKFIGFASIPMSEPSIAVKEIKRSVSELGFKGIIVSSNTQGRFYDAEEYDPVFHMLEKLRVPMFIHPTESVAAKQIGQDYKLALTFGWPFDTTLCISRLILSGTLENFPDLKIIAAHGGGMIPFFTGRIDMLSKVAAGKGKKIAVEKPAESFKKLYYDTAFFDPDSLELLVKFAGADHVVYASDYPFGQNLGKNCYEKSISMMDRAKLDSESKEMIYGGNISQLVGIP